VSGAFLGEAREYAAQESGGEEIFPRQRDHSQRHTGEHRHHASRHELRKRIDSLRKHRLILSLMTTGALMTCVVLAFATHQLQSDLSDVKTTLTEEREASRARLGEAEANLATTRKALKTALASMDALVEKRIPGLTKLRFDQVIPIEQGSVRDLTFTRVRGSEKNAYELKTVIENKSAAPVSPAASIVLFDEVGVQVGRTQIGPEGKSEGLTLRPGEIRSLFDVVEIDPGRKAHYFRLEATTD